VVSAIERSNDVVVIDTPGRDSNLMRLAPSMADALVRPLNTARIWPRNSLELGVNYGP
jgi:hypothetical protein